MAERNLNLPTYLVPCKENVPTWTLGFHATERSSFYLEALMIHSGVLLTILCYIITSFEASHLTSTSNKVTMKEAKGTYYSKSSLLVVQEHHHIPFASVPQAWTPPRGKTWRHSVSRVNPFPARQQVNIVWHG